MGKRLLSRRFRREAVESEHVRLTVVPTQTLPDDAAKELRLALEREIDVGRKITVPDDRPRNSTR
jgi:hypothetical protein